MANEKGQTAVEVIIIAVVLLGMLLATAIIMTQNNSETSRLSAIQQNTAKCQSITATITGFNSSKAYSEVKLPQLDKRAFVKSGSVLIEGISCSYVGKALKQTSDGTSPVFEHDITGFYLEPEKAYKAKKSGQGVLFCDIAQTGC